MLGEELESTMISRDYFSSLYNAVADMIFVLNNLAEIEDFNNSVAAVLSGSALSLKGTPIDRFIHVEKGNLSTQIRKVLVNGRRSMTVEGLLHVPNASRIPVSITASEVYRKSRFRSGYLLILEDITHKKEQESLILRTIVETQEAERRRVADDLHDSLGQKLSAVKFYMNALGNLLSESSDEAEALRSAKRLLNDSIGDLRDIVFDQMPITLEKFGLAEAIHELVTRLRYTGVLHFHVDIAEDIPILNKNLQVVIYRIIQEFIQNTMKHAKAENIYIDLLMRRKELMLRLEDDGQGFDPDHMSEHSGRGIRNMLTRVKAFEGRHQLRSKPGQGVKLVVYFTLSETH
jgi:PAS domain S-box-containing protein